MEPESGRSIPIPPSRGKDLEQRSIPGGLARLGPFLAALVAALVLATFGAAPSSAAPALVIDARTGAVLYEEQATVPWYPASLTKLMTAYVALDAVRRHEIAVDTPLVVSARAAAAPPSKMGFRPGTLVTLDNALKMLMVKSANDIAITIAEGISGSVEAFAEDMNKAAASLGLVQSHFVNPNGLPDPHHVSSARDMAILAQALVLRFPDHAELFSIGALRLGDDIIKNHNHMLGRYPGADGMKTGFTCAAGFNLVASATRDGHKIIAVVLGAPNVEQRTLKTALLFDRAFAGIDRPRGHVVSLPTSGVSGPPDMRIAICRKPAATIAEFAAEAQRLARPFLGSGSEAGTDADPFTPYSSAASAIGAPMALRLAMVPQLAFDPVPVTIGAPDGYSGPLARARPPHSPIGTEPSPIEQAYAAAKRAPPGAKGSSPGPDIAALPAKGHGKPLRSAAGKKTSTQMAVAVSAGKVAKAGKAPAAPKAKASGPARAEPRAEPAPAKLVRGKPLAETKPKPAAKPENL